MIPLIPPPAPEWVPVDSCTLPTVERPLRVAAFDAMFADHLRSVEHPHGSPHARLILAGDETLADRVRQLTNAETACCSFFTFTLTPPSRGTLLALDVTVPEARTGVLDALVDRARRAAW